MPARWVRRENGGLSRTSHLFSHLCSSKRSTSGNVRRETYYLLLFQEPFRVEGQAPNYNFKNRWQIFAVKMPFQITSFCGYLARFRPHNEAFGNNNCLSSSVIAAKLRRTRALLEIFWSSRVARIMGRLKKPKGTRKSRDYRRKSQEAPGYERGFKINLVLLRYLPLHVSVSQF